MRQLRNDAAARRDKSLHALYGSRWRRARAAFLRRFPLCQGDQCRANGELTPATVVDHKVAHRGDLSLFWDQSNWQSLCKSCHDRKTATVDGGFGRVRATAASTDHVAADR